MGFQAVNGNSIVDFPENSRTPNMIKFMGEIRCNNIENTDLISIIRNALNHSNLEEENIKKELDKELLSKEQLTSNILNRLDDNKITSKEDKNKIQRYKLKQMVDNLEKTNLKHELKKEKPIVVVLDNYAPHRNADFKKACKTIKYNFSSFATIFSAAKSYRTSLEINKKNNIHHICRNQRRIN